MDIDKGILQNINIDINKATLKNINIDMEILKNNNIDIDKIKGECPGRWVRSVI